MKRAKKERFPVKAALLVSLFIASLFLDKPTTAAVANFNSPMLARAVAGFNSNYFWIYAGMLGLTAIALLASKKKRNSGESALEMASSILSAMAVTYLLKPIFHRLRPDGIIFVSPLLGNIDYSFPSGHSTSASAAAFSTSALKIPWAIFAAATIFARVFSNAHFLSDTIAGVIVSAVVVGLIKGKIKKLTVEDRVELRRQVMHALTGIAVAIFVARYPSMWPALVAIAVSGLGISYAVRKTKAKLLTAALALVERKDAIEKFPGKGAITLFIGSAITAALFREQAVAAIIILAIGDSVGPIAGRLLGKTSHKGIFDKRKNMEGTAYGFVFAGAAAALLAPPWHAVMASAAAMAVEAMHIKILGRKVDDNITMPVVAAAVIKIMTYL